MTMNHIKSGTQGSKIMENTNVYILFGASGDYDDYHEYIMYMYDNRKSAVNKMKQLRLEQKKDLERWSMVCHQLADFDEEYNIDDMWAENCQKVDFSEYLDDPEKYQDCLQLFTPPERQLIIDYTKLNKEFESLGGVSGLIVNDVLYLVRVYSYSPNGEIVLKDVIHDYETE